MGIMHDCKLFCNKKLEKVNCRKLRERLKNKDITIVSNNCMAGIIYHNLGLKFLSPTINLHFGRAKEYYDFVTNFEYYSKCDVIEDYTAVENFPVGIIKPIDDNHIPIKLYFQHYKTFEEAKSKWVERYARVNWDNIYYIWEFYDTLGDVDLMYKFDKLELKHKILITHKEFKDLNNYSAVSCYNNDRPFGAIFNYKGISGKRNLEEFNYVDFFNK